MLFFLHFSIFPPANFPTFKPSLAFPGNGVSLAVRQFPWRQKAISNRAPGRAAAQADGFAGGCRQAGRQTE